MAINPAQVRALIAQGKLEEALEAMAAHFPDTTLQLSRLRTAKRERNLHIISSDEWNRTLAQISAAALDMLENPASPSPPASAVPAPPVQAPKDAPPSVSPHISWILGLVLLIGSAATLLAAFPCPTSNEARAFSILMALGAAGVASVLPGLFHIEMTGIKAGSALGVFVMVYLLNPANAINDDSRCQKQPFEFTIALMPDKQLRLSPQYPKLNEATLKIRLANKWEPAPVNAEGDADYKSIPGDFKDSAVALQLTARNWRLERDSVVLSGKSATLTLVPDGTLGRVTGRVWESDGSTPIADASVEWEDMSAKTNARGAFALDVPVEKQKTPYRVRIAKTGYDSINDLVPFDGETVSFRLKKQPKRK
jgi:hypothetical protein